MDLAGFVVAGFLIDPPTVGSVFAVAISQVIAVTGTGQKNRGQQDKGKGCGNESTFGKHPSHGESNPFYHRFEAFIPIASGEIGGLMSIHEACTVASLLDGPITFAFGCFSANLTRFWGSSP